MQGPSGREAAARRLAWAVAALVGAGAAAQAAPLHWTRVATTDGFSVERPDGWMTLGVAGERVDIVSGACRQGSAIVCPGEAEILVRAEPVATRRKALKAKACWSLVETVTETADASGRRLQNSQLSCAIADRRFVILERHWKGDKHAAAYGRIAMRMAKSLRYPG
jgi:hypothetical protein